MSMWKKAMDYLGLGPEDAYDDYYDDEYYDEPEPERPVRSQRAPRDDMQRGPRGYSDYPPEQPSRGHARPGPSSREGDVVVRRSIPDDSTVRPRPSNPRPALVAVSATTAEPHTVSPRRFDSAQEIADKFRDGQPVIMNLEATDRDLSRRLIDFASGLCYGLGGTMEKVATGVYLLKPAARGGYGSDL